MKQYVANPIGPNSPTHLVADNRGISKRLEKLTGKVADTDGSWLRRAATATEVAEEK